VPFGAVAAIVQDGFSFNAPPLPVPFLSFERRVAHQHQRAEFRIGHLRADWERDSRFVFPSGRILWRFRGGRCSIDRVLCGLSLDRFSDRQDLDAALAGLARPLSPGGIMVMTIDNPLNPVVRIRKRLPYRLLRRLHLVSFYIGVTLGPAEARRQMEEAGLIVTNVTAIAHAPRLPAVWFSLLTERLGSARLDRALGRVLTSFDRLEKIPTRYRTGYYVAVRAEKPVARRNGRG